MTAFIVLDVLFYLPKLPACGINASSVWFHPFNLNILISRPSIGG